jgi:hypothetical protein
MNGNGDAAWAETLVLHSGDDPRYMLRFAKAPALDGLINAFTIPLHGWMYVMRPAGGHMSLVGPGGGRTRFATLLERLQELGVVGATGHRVRVPQGAVRYRVNLRRLRQGRVLALLDELQRDEFPGKPLRKVFRYLRIASRSSRANYITLDRWLYDHDRQGSVLQRLNRWVDAGYLELAAGITTRYEIRLNATRRGLSDGMLKIIKRENKVWADHKRKSMREMMRILHARSPQHRQRRVLQYFGEVDWHKFEHDPEVLSALPKWLLT